MLNLLWIIGNGFDRNLGLATDYRSFLKNRYFKDGVQNKYRDELVKRVEGFSPERASELWCDLENLLGRASAFYEDDEELFHETFENIQDEFLDYVFRESSRMPVELPQEAVQEFRASISSFYTRLTAVDVLKGLPALMSTSEDVTVHVLVLNYTNTVNRFWDEIGKDQPFGKLIVGTTPKFFYQGTLLHLHGEINDGGTATNIIFGVSDSDQITSPVYSSKVDFQELWVKEKKNYGIYGNTKTAEMSELIAFVYMAAAWEKAMVTFGDKWLIGCQIRHAGFIFSTMVYPIVLRWLPGLIRNDVVIWPDVSMRLQMWLQKTRNRYQIVFPG